MSGDEAEKAGMIVPEMPTVYCVIPVHNRLETTTRCLDYLGAQDYPAVKIVIVDDGSTDGTGEYLAQCGLPNLTALTGDGNLWWGGAMHMGIAHVLKVAGKDDFLLMLNDDVRVEANYVATLVSDSVAKGGAVVGSAQRDEVSGVLLASGFMIDYWGMRILPAEAPYPLEGVDALPGRGALFPMRAVMSAGNINVNVLPHYLGDVEYSARIREMGWTIAISNAAKIFTSSTSSDENIRGQGFTKAYFSFRSKNDLRQRLWFFSLRGPWYLRFWALPRYVVVGGWRWLWKAKK
ncbi:MAG: glycosyltransferase family 2 protein [Gallionella sp.]